MRKANLIVVALVLISMTFGATVLPERVRATTLYVGGTDPGNYTTIQAAIDNSTPDSTVYVYSGTYQENVVIGKTLTIIGEDRNTTTIDGGGTGDVVYVTADWVNFTGFTLVNGGPYGSYGGDSGIELDGAKNCHIVNNNVSSNQLGISLSNSGQNYITDNTAMNTEISVLVWNSFWNKIVNNTISDSDTGIHFFASWFDKVWDNYIAFNDEGIHMVNSHNNLIHHNEFIDNWKQASDIGTNQWDNGYPSGGNFWSDYLGVDEKSGPNQDLDGSDQIGDWPWNVSGGLSKDRYPLLRSPSEPQNLQAMPGNGRVNLSWEEPALAGGVPITHYIIYRGTSPGGVAFLAETGSTSSYTDPGLANCQPYYYRISARNSIGEGLKSEEVLAVPATLPGAPTELSATEGDNEVSLVWSTPTGDSCSPITNYTIYRGTVQNEETLLATIGNVLSYVDTDVSNDITYYYRVAAKNGVGEGAKSNEASATPHVNRPPTCIITAPLSVTWISGTYTIEGTAFDSDGTVLKVEIRIGDGNWTQLAGTTSWSYDWNTTAIANGHTMVYARAYDGMAYSTEVSVTAVVNNTIEPPPSDDGDSDSQRAWAFGDIIWLVLVTTVIVAVVLVAFLGAKMRKQLKERKRP